MGTDTGRMPWGSVRHGNTCSFAQMEAKRRTAADFSPCWDQEPQANPLHRGRPEGCKVGQPKVTFTVEEYVGKGLDLVRRCGCLQGRETFKLSFSLSKGLPAKLHPFIPSFGCKPVSRGSLG